MWSSENEYYEKDDDIKSRMKDAPTSGSVGAVLAFLGHHTAAALP